MCHHVGGDNVGTGYNFWGHPLKISEGKNVQNLVFFGQL